MESPFPNLREQIVASALILLSSSTPSNEKIMSKCNGDYSESLLICNSNSRSSASSSVTSDDVSSEETHGPGLYIVASPVARSHHELKLKVVRKSRSKTLWISDCRKITNVVPAKSVSSDSPSETMDASSSLSSGSSSLVSSSRMSCNAERKREKALARNMTRKPSSVANSAHLIRRSEAILKVLAHNGSASEVRIRQLLGDSPDTSKALRMLLKKEEVKRSGAGGRSDPYIYQISK